jgi:hypothetical protein
LRQSLKSKLLKLYTILPKPYDNFFDILPFFITQAIALSFPDLFIQIKHFEDYQGALKMVTREICGYILNDNTLAKQIKKYKRTEEELEEL